MMKINEKKTIKNGGYNVLITRIKNDTNGNGRYKLEKIDGNSVIKKVYCSGYKLEDYIKGTITI